MVEAEVKILTYKIHKSSSHLSNYAPENIMVDEPFDQSSRWSTSTSNHPQFLTIKLDKPAIVKYLTFGKFNKPHICNLKKFTVLGGMQDGLFSELLSGGLENNNVKERFEIIATRGGVAYPVQFLSLMPQVAWGPSFNFCVWYLQVEGVDDLRTVRSALYKFNLRAEEETIRACLKHLRQQRYTGAFAALQQETGVQLEAPLLSQLHTLLVEKGDFTAAEELLHQAAQDGLFEWYTSWQQYAAQWNVILQCSSVGDCDAAQRSTSNNVQTVCGATHGNVQTYCDENSNFRPGKRGGHQMCMDSETNTLYLFGGWDGSKDLSDFWSYSVHEDKWTLICRHSEKIGGPTPRSCHKMVFDAGRRQLFTLGRYLESKNRDRFNTKSDLYVFDIAKGSWWQICEDTEVRGGPKLLFDHQMCVDSQRNIIYVFGGRVLPAFGEDDSQHVYSGLYSYHIAEDRWRLLSTGQPSPSEPLHILSRASHSMLFHPVTRTLYIFGGQRHKQFLTDMVAVGVGTEDEGRLSVTGVCRVPPRKTPNAGYTQRATIDPQLNEIYVIAGLSKEKNMKVSSTMWVFSLKRMQWNLIHMDTQAENYWETCDLAPCPRYAHTMVYDPACRVHYLFGGNPGSSGNTNLRLDDFWSLKLTRTCAEAAWRQARLSIRRLQFSELVRAGQGTEALCYLQTHLHQATDHSQPEEAREFQLMATMLFSEQEQAFFFHPPLEPKIAELSETRLDPEMPEEIQTGNKFESHHDENKVFDSEQQALFAAVLGIEPDDELPSASVMREKIVPRNTKIVITDEEVQKNCVEMEVHFRRCELFQQLSNYFPQHMTQPKSSITELIKM